MIKCAPLITVSLDEHIAFGAMTVLVVTESRGLEVISMLAEELIP